MLSHETIQRVKPAEMDPEHAESIRALSNQILITIPHRPGEGIHHKLVELIPQWANVGMAVRLMRDPFGGFIEKTRNHIVHEFLKSEDRKYLMMLDNDVIPKDPAAPLQLASHGEPVVSGVACALRPSVGLFACVTVMDEAGVARFPTVQHTKTIPATGMSEIKSCGTGVVVIRRDVLETIGSSWFDIPEAQRVEADAVGHLKQTEDICFCDRVRKAGFKLYVDWSIHCWHDKTLPLDWPMDGIDDKLEAKDWSVSNFALEEEKR